MAHPIFQFAYSRRHPGSTKAGNIGFYTVVGIVAVAILVMLGIFLVAQGALEGVADVVKPAIS